MNAAEKLARIARKIKAEEKPDVTIEVNSMYRVLMLVAESVAQRGEKTVETFLSYPDRASMGPPAIKAAVNRALVDMLAEDGFRCPHIIDQNHEAKITFHFEG
ncbi:hypothetical protein UFOVP276_223 [uncultured Caudovirales phage]|uniref:Uncharacterized protein n=1 Tax=uncultured Caudovirales phage TaxID=2100421 RepID=A0A6J5LQH9_9CAUD|nr:hypothetical protein UFOVP127_117 [uncultured Caudovirales phage]CAB4135267.1 hypothetical protein UFOVP276_223 [uncultured Caudovirales phage]